MALLDEVATYLGSVSPSLGTITKGLMPATPDEVVTIYEYSGDPPALGFGTPGIAWESPGLQIMVRSQRPSATNDAYATARAKIEAAWKAVAEIQGVSLSGTYYRIARPTGQPSFYERDESGRVKFVVNFIVEKDLSV